VTKLIPAVYGYLAKRRDIQILANDSDRIVGVQLRRVWEKFIYNANVFSPHERERWHYYGQAFVIEEADMNKKGELSAEQEALAKGLGALGAVVILAQTMGYVMATLGPEPLNWDEYARKVEK